jgi:hypothetical protein
MAGATVQDRMLTTAEAAEYLGKKPRTLQNWRNNLHTGPRYSGVRNGIRYRISDLDAWVAASTRT